MPVATEHIYIISVERFYTMYLSSAANHVNNFLMPRMGKRKRTLQTKLALHIFQITAFPTNAPCYDGILLIPS